MADVNDKKLPKSLIRIIDILMRLLQGEKLNSEEIAQSYDVQKRTVYRDLQIIRENPIFSDNYHLEFDESQKNRFVVKDEGISINEVLAIIQILIGVRALSKPELKETIYHLRELVSVKDQPKIDQLLKVEYLPVKSSGDLFIRIGEFTEFIKSNAEIEFTYRGSLSTSDDKKVRHGVPVSLYFSDFYFYVVIFSDDKGSRTCRLDRMISYKKVNKSTTVQRSKLKDGTTIRNYTYLLNGGRKSYFKIQSWTNPQVALDRLPNSRVVKSEADGSVIIEGYLYLQGLKLWILGEGTFVKVLEPASLVTEVKEELQATLKQYDNGESHEK